ncbi:MAG TPA: anti-sigma factor [Acidimicrobiia bacterium]|nr:anti-sigma factor [Acidimicrobiia bacterium]
MTDDRADYLAAATGQGPTERARLDLIRQILASEAAWAEPPPEVADRLLAAIGSTKRSAVATRSPRRRRWGWAAAISGAAAAAAVALAGVFGVFSAPNEQVVEIAGTDLEPAATGEAAIGETDAGWWIRLDIEQLPAAEPGTYYEGWMWNDQGEGVSIGTFHLRGGTEPVVLWSGVDPIDYPAIWVTLEDEDGDPSASDRVVMRGRP